MHPVKQLTLHYLDLDSDVRKNVSVATDEIKSRLAEGSRYVVEIGERLIYVKEVVGHGEFQTWLKNEFAWTVRTAQRLMAVAEYVKSDNVVGFEIQPSALYLLASPSTPVEVKEKVKAKAAAGEKVTHKDVKREIEKVKPDRAAPATQPTVIATVAETESEAEKPVGEPGSKPKPAPAAPEPKPAAKPAEPWMNYNARIKAVEERLIELRDEVLSIRAADGIDGEFASWINAKDYKAMFNEVIARFHNHQVIAWAAERDKKSLGRNFLYSPEIRKVKLNGGGK